MEDAPRSMHRRAVAIAGDHVRQVTSRDLSSATPCTAWTLADLLAHMVGQHLGFAAAVATGDAPRSAYAPVAFSVATWDASVSALLAAFDGASPDDTAVLIEIAPTPLPMARVVAAQLLDTVVHTWDIAQAIGRSYEPPSDVVAAVSHVAFSIPDGDRRNQQDAPFAPALRLPGSPWERALAQLGRDPRPHDPKERVRT